MLTDAQWTMLEPLVHAHKAAGARRKGALKLSETHVKRLGALAAGLGPKPA